MKKTLLAVASALILGGTLSGAALAQSSGYSDRDSGYQDSRYDDDRYDDDRYDDDARYDNRRDDERYARDGRSIERLGYFNPIAAGKEVPLELNVARANEWIAKGAQPTEKVRSLLKQAAKQVAAAAA